MIRILIMFFVGTGIAGFAVNSRALAADDVSLPLAHAEELKKRAPNRKILHRIDPQLGHREAFRHQEVGEGVLVVGGGDAGVLYGVQELTMRHSVVGADGAPDFDLRGAVLMMLSASWAYQSDLSPEVYPWFFDRALMTRYLDYLFSARLNTLVLWSGHLFPHILELPDYPHASQFSKEEIRRNQEQFRWLTTEAAKRNITVLTHFYNIHISEHMARAMGRVGTEEADASRYVVPDDFVRGYYRAILKRYFAEFPNVGLYICPGESLALREQQAWFRDVIFRVAKESGKNPKLIIRDWTLDADFKSSLPGMYENLYSELKHNDETIASPRADLRHADWKGFLSGHIVNLHDPADATPYRVGSPALIREMIGHWKQSGYFKGAWFYPPQCWVWPYTLDSLGDGSTPLVQFERDELWHLLEGRYLWRAKRDASTETQWAGDWLGRKFDNPQIGAALVDWYELTGPILPGLQNLTAVRFGNFFPTSVATVQATVDDLLTYRTRLDDPRPEGPTGYTHQRYYAQPVDQYTLSRYQRKYLVATLRDERPMPVAQLATEIAAGRDANEYVRPDRLIELYLEMAKESQELAVSALLRATLSVHREELTRFVQDSACLIMTIEYYQLKLLAALEKKRYQLTGDKKRLQSFRHHMADSVMKYQEMYSKTRAHYRAGSGMFHALTWEQTFERRVKWDFELQEKWLEALDR